MPNPLAQYVDPPHSVAREEIAAVEDVETGLGELRLDHRTGDHEAVLVVLGRPPTLQAPALPGLVVAVHPQRDDQRVARDAVEFAQHRQAMRRVGDVMQQAHAEDAVHRVVAHVDGEGRGLEGLHPLDHLQRLRGLGDGQHVGGIVRGEDHPARVLGQKGPEAPGPTGQIEDQIGLAGDFQRASRHLLVTPMRQPSGEAVLVLVQVFVGVLAVVLARELKFDGARCRHVGHSGEDGAPN